MPTPVPQLDDLVERFDHIAMAVWDIAKAVTFAEMLGGQFRDGGNYEAGGFRWAQWDLPQSGKLEMVQPLDSEDGDHFLIKFLRGRGEGLHHLTFKVTDIGAAITRAEQHGFEVVRVNLENPRWREAFVHPRSAHGVLVQLAQWDEWPERERQTIDHVLRTANPTPET